MAHKTRAGWSTTLRETALTAMLAEVSAAVAKDHERNYEKLLIDRDGTVRWVESINKSDDLIDDRANTRSVSPIPSVVTVGTGSIDCNCDHCNAVYSKAGEDYAAERAEEGEEEAARAAYRDSHGYQTEAEAIADAVINSDLDGLEESMQASFDAIPDGYFDDEAAEDE